jgi:phosphoribosylformimino-5-aminoimidazole carboxamide ribotide isomerase
VEDQGFLERALTILGPERLVVAVDAEDGFVKTKGWQERSRVRAADLVGVLEKMGVREILYTDISRDGMMQNVNLEGIRELALGSDVEIIASGGVTGLDDLRALRTLEPVGITGVIAGRALYEGRFTVKEALAVLEAADVPDSSVNASAGVARESGDPDPTGAL